MLSLIAKSSERTLLVYEYSFERGYPDRGASWKMFHLYTTNLTPEFQSLRDSFLSCFLRCCQFCTCCRKRPSACFSYQYVMASDFQMINFLVLIIMFISNCSRELNKLILKLNLPVKYGKIKGYL